MEKEKKLYVVSNAHLDTQWNWTVQDTIRDCVKSTLEKNFELIEKYPHYKMNFEGAFRYKLAKEYYPDLYEKLKGYIAEGRWTVSGSTWDAMDVNVPSSEALMRQVLYGNGYFEKEFGKKSTDIFLTDCFGFRYALPSIEAHMGLNGFSTQKLVWGVGGPVINEDGSVTKPMPVKDKPRMDLGKWVGPDGNYVVGSLLEGNYTYNFDNDGNTTPVNKREEFLKDIEHNEKYAHVPYRAMYYGTGDYGGSPKESSARMVNEAIEDNANGLYKVISSSTDQIFNELTKEEIDNLPAYNGELLIPHGSGALTSHTINKRWNRKNELLADSAERAAVLSAWLGASEYPAERLLTAWQTFLWHQFHDDLPGTSIAAAYVFTYNDYVIALNMFASELANAIGGVVGTLDTRVEGTPVVVYNPVSYTRDDVVTAEIDVKTPFVRVFDSHGNEVPAQLGKENGRTVVKFKAAVAPVSCTVFDVRGSETECQVKTGISVTANKLENQRYIVTINEDGDIASIVDKANGNFELLASPAKLEIGPDKSTNWPSWELVWDDALVEPAVVKDNVKVEIADNGPAVVSLKVTRKFEGSTFEQTISLCDGGERVDVANVVDWFQRKSNLRAAFPLTVSNPKAVFDLGLGAIESGNTDSFPYYQHCTHQWADLTAEDGSYGVSIMNDCKYGMDKPNDNTLRLTLIHTPLGKFMNESGQDWQDMGLNIFTYSIAGHKGFRDGTTKEAAELNQPMMPFTASKHAGEGKEISFVSVSDDNVVVRAIKKEENGERIIIRVQETSGKGSENCTLKFLGKLTSVTETNGYEDEIAPVSFDGDKFSFTLTPYAVKTFAVTLAAPAKKAETSEEVHVKLPFTRRVTTYNSARTSRGFADGISIPSELYSENVTAGGVSFKLAPAVAHNALVCEGQKIAVPADYDTLYILAASAHGDKTVQFSVDDKTVSVGIQDFKADVGAWEQLVNGRTPLVKRDEIAVNYTHTHDKDGDRLYLFAYLFKYAIPVTGAKEVVLPNDSDIVVMAATFTKRGNDDVTPLAPLYDRVDNAKAPVHNVTVLGLDGSVREVLAREEGKAAVVKTDSYSNGWLFKGWDCEYITAECENEAVVKVPDHDITVGVKAEKLGENVLLNKPCKTSSDFNERETGAQALNGDENSKWCAESENGEHWLEADIGEVTKIGGWFVMHAGVQESAGYNTSDFRLEYKVNENDEWKCADEVKDNHDSTTNRSFAPVEARYVRLYITKAEQGRGRTTRINMFEVFKA